MRSGLTNKPAYRYGFHYGGWAVYKMTYIDNIDTGEKVFYSNDREAAKKECYRLNGWNYKENNKK